MTTANRLGRWGLRTRLLLAFALLAVVTTTIVAGVLYWRARTVILQTTQDAAAATLTDQVETLLPLTTLPPDGAELERVVDALADRGAAAVVLFRGRQVSEGLDPVLLTPELRGVVASGRVAWQRIDQTGTRRPIGCPATPAPPLGWSAARRPTSPGWSTT